MALDKPRAGSPGGAVTVGPQDADRIGEIARALAPVADGRIDTPEWVDAARTAWCDLPVGLRRALRSFRRDSGPSGALLVRGLPVGEETLPETPTVRGSVQRTADVAAAVLLTVASGLGDPAAFRPEKTGALVQDVVPVPGQEDFQGNAGSVLLSFHTENAFHPHRPDFVMLLCLRADHEGVAGLRTACVRQVLPLLSDTSRTALQKEEFVTDAPPSFGSVPGAAAPHAVLTGAADDPDVRVDFAATRATTRRAQSALDELNRLFDLTAQTIRLTPGDLAIVDNRVTVHGRTSFRPRYDGQDRWLQRSFVLTDLRRSRGLRAQDGYVLD
ncbi:TauD/TfdA family dioxygenase [Streptomyces racemochromogenes]|uniref:TauD/TfdA family dioxygenase n=1 Tax=Streptomyces racemochromogenes TaxID=67353 RepID=A0ABW7PMG6_9ACTN